MPQKIRKILSLALLLTLSFSTFGFVIHEKSCECCEVNCVEETTKSCCEPETKLPPCCQPKSETVVIQENSCQCTHLTCDTSEYIKEEFSFVLTNTLEFNIKRKIEVIQTIDISKITSVEETLKFLENDPPPVCFRTRDYLIQISTLKIPLPQLC